MPHKFFISHYSGDKHIAELFSNVLRRITLNQISPWFSSDTAEGSGLQPGDIWFNQILSKISQSKSVVVLLTPNSINRPWIFFESGIGQALNGCEVIPVCIGIKKDSLLPPLGLYQCYQLNDYRSVVEFFSKLLTLFEVGFDEEMSKVVIEKLVKEIAKIRFENPNSPVKETATFESLVEKFVGHIDLRFSEIMKRTDAIQLHNSGTNPMTDETSTNYLGYNVSFSIELPKMAKKTEYIEIRPDETFQSITSAIFYAIGEFVDAFHYLEQWVIVDETTNKHLIIREIADQIPANVIFKPNTKWKVVLLKQPYNASESGNRIREKFK